MNEDQIRFRARLQGHFQPAGLIVEALNGVER
jgi:hypothetical protein